MKRELLSSMKAGRERFDKVLPNDVVRANGFCPLSVFKVFTFLILSKI